MKGGIAAGLLAISALERTGTSLSYDVEVQLVVGEETTGVGTRLAIASSGRPFAAIVLEPTGNAVVPVSTGLQFFTVTLTGRAAHTSAPWRGVDAFELLLAVRGAMIRTADERSAAYSHPLFGGLPTAIPSAAGVIRAGEHRAAVPSTASMSGRYGLAPGESIAQVRQHYLAAIEEVTSADPWLAEHPPEVLWDNDGLPGWETPPADRLILALSEAQREVTGDTGFLAFTAGSDAAAFGAASIPTAIFGPGDVSLAHAPDEQVSEREVVEAAKVIALALAGLS